jgi:hypothetical protein
MTFLIGVVNSINCQVEPNLHLENFHFPIFLKPAVTDILDISIFYKSNL